MKDFTDAIRYRAVYQSPDGDLHVEYPSSAQNAYDIAYERKKANPKCFAIVEWRGYDGRWHTSAISPVW